ncbi:MAG: dihydroneopterin aldolase [Bacteroidales bacterium]|nr:dihydroneopterin aldolase [Bacteroidales bacterium]
MTELALQGMKFRAPVGCFPEEKMIFSNIEVDLIITYDAEKAMQTDELKYALNYQDIYIEVSHIVEKSYNLLERLLFQIGESLLNKFTQISNIEVIVKKNHPSLGGEIESVSVKKAFSRTIRL